MFHDPENGQHIYYTIQHKKVKESKWLDVKEGCKLYDVEDVWHDSSFDHFGFGGGEHAVWEKTGNKGWYDEKKAKKQLKIAQKKSGNGEYNYKHHGQLQQIQRHEFRIVKVTLIFHKLQEPVLDV